MFIYSKCFAGSSRKNVYTLPYAFIYQKSVYITIHTKPLCTAHFPAAGSNVHTHAYAFYFKKVTPYHTYQFAGSSQEKKTKHSFAGRLSAATTLRGAHCGVQEQRPCTAPILPLPTPCTQFAGHTPRCRAQVSPVGHTPPLPRSQKQKKV